MINPHGSIVFRAHWSSASSAIEHALRNLLTGARIARLIKGGTVRASIRMLGFAGTALDRGGSTAWRDLWRAAPPLALLNAVSNKLTCLPAQRRGGVVAVIASSVIAATVLLI